MKLFGFSTLKRPFIALATAVTVAVSGAAYAQQLTADTREGLLWLYVQQLGTADAFAAYLAEFPNGDFAADARGSLVVMAAEGIFPSQNIEGFQIAEIPATATVANPADLGRFFVIEYAG